MSGIRVRVITDRPDGVYVQLDDLADLIHVAARETVTRWPDAAFGVQVLANALPDSIKAAIENRRHGHATS